MYGCLQSKQMNDYGTRSSSEWTQSSRTGILLIKCKVVTANGGKESGCPVYSVHIQWHFMCMNSGMVVNSAICPKVAEMLVNPNTNLAFRLIRHMLTWGGNVVCLHSWANRNRKKVTSVISVLRYGHRGACTCVREARCLVYGQLVTGKSLKSNR